KGAIAADEGGKAEAKKVHCEGVNACKGQGACGGGGPGCAGQKTRQGKGGVDLSARGCKGKGGTAKEHSLHRARGSGPAGHAAPATCPFTNSPSSASALACAPSTTPRSSMSGRRSTGSRSSRKTSWCRADGRCTSSSASASATPSPCTACRCRSVRRIHCRR